jgi:predicted transposase/invertase (TIGR01784 family)
MKFVDIKNDIAFRKIFGSAKKSICLISFLNAVLELEGLSRIKSVTLLNPYLIPRLLEEKSSIIDVRATDQKGRRFVVEMQIADKKGFKERVQYYTARDFSMQIDKGEDYTKLRPVYFVGILNFSNSRGVNYLSKHLTIEEETGDNVLDDIKYAFIQLPKFKKKEHELVTPTDKWTFFIKNAENLKMIPDYVDEEGLLTAFQEADKHNWKKEELIAYDNASMRIQDARGEKELAHEQGLEEGREKGREEGLEIGRKKGLEIGIEKGKEEAVIGLYQNGISIAIIALSLKIQESKVTQIISDYKKLT